jgi:hypothetical protein
MYTYNALKERAIQAFDSYVFSKSPIIDQGNNW